MRGFIFLFLMFVTQPFVFAQNTGARVYEATPENSSNPCQSQALTQHIPRSSGDISERPINLNENAGPHRDQQTLNYLRQGRIPEHLRHLRPVTIPNPNNCASQAPIIICVMPDYLSLGSSQNYTHIPMGREAAIQAASDWGFLLPTPRMVDAIYAQADTQLSPSPMPPNNSMTTTTYARRHSQTIQSHITAQSGLIAGNKKDVVMTNRMARTSSVPIYGWHRNETSPIQSLSTVHGGDYADYSHGIRLVSQTAFINGRAYSLKDLLAHPRCSAGLSSEGPLTASVLEMFSEPHSSALSQPSTTTRSQSGTY